MATTYEEKKIAHAKLTLYTSAIESSRDRIEHILAGIEALPDRASFGIYGTDIPGEGTLEDALFQLDLELLAVASDLRAEVTEVLEPVPH